MEYPIVTSLLKPRTLYFLLVTLAANVHAQESFQLAYDFGYHQQQALRVLAVDSFIFTTGVALPFNTPENERMLYVAKFDSKGNYITHAVTDDEDNTNTHSNQCRMMVKIGDEIFNATSNGPSVDTFISYHRISGYNTTDNSFRFVHRVNPTPPNIISDYVTCLLKTEDDKLGLVLISRVGDQRGVKMTIVDPAQPYIVQDSFHLIKPSHRYITEEAILFENHYYLLGYLNNDDTDEEMLYIIKLDSSLNLVSENYYDDLVYDGREINAHFDELGNLYMVASYDRTFPQNQLYNLTVIMKLDPNLDVVWQKKFGNLEFKNDFQQYYDVAESHNKNGIIMVGVREGNGFSYPVIAKVSSEGDSVYYKELQPLDGYNSHTLYNLDKTPDGNYIAAGDSWPLEYQDSIYFEGLLLKFDDNGNVCPREKTSSVEEIKEIGASIYPNPVSEVLYIDVTEALTSISLFNSSGEKILEKRDIDKGRILFLPVSEFNSGSYFLHFMTSDKSRIIKKVQIVR